MIDFCSSDSVRRKFKGVKKVMEKCKFRKTWKWKRLEILQKSMKVFDSEEEMDVE